MKRTISKPRARELLANTRAYTATTFIRPRRRRSGLGLTSEGARRDHLGDHGAALAADELRGFHVHRLARLGLREEGPFSDARTTSPHMLEYFRYDIPAMRQYACEARRGGYFFTVSEAQEKRGLQTREATEGAMVAGGIDDAAVGRPRGRSRVRAGWIARLTTVRGRGEAGGDRRTAPRLPDRAPSATRSFPSWIAPSRLGLERARATKRRETDVVRRRERRRGYAPRS